MIQASNWARLPAELKALRQWCVAGADKSPQVAGPKGFFNVGDTEKWRDQWLSFDQAASQAYAHGRHIGFVLTSSDPFCCVDLDVCDAQSQQEKGEPIDPTKWTTQEQLNRYWNIVQRFDSYTEKSRSGKGLHIWVQGHLQSGRRREGVEVYYKDRFIICTGDVLMHKPVSERQQLLQVLITEMAGPDAAPTVELEEVEQEDSDSEVINRAITATNSEKFNDLCMGDWQKYGFPSQSEADLALMSMFCFYTKSNEQCRRLFRMTALGRREKAVKNDRYLNYTIRICRSREARDAYKEIHGEQLARQLVAELQGFGAGFEPATALTPPLLHVPGGAESIQLPQPPEVGMALQAPAPEPVVSSSANSIDWPPGLAGQIAWYVYQSAPRPVKEVAIVAAIGLLAGICGKSWSIPQSGLNMYIILIARSAVGKEAMHSGTSSLLSAVINRQPAAAAFVDFSDFASGPALQKAVAANPCFLNVSGEWGRKLRGLAQEDTGKGSGPYSSLRTVMTNLYQKSGPQSIVGGISYSNREGNVASVSGVSYSMIGESTPRTFYDSLTETMMEDGFMSRFLVIEYDGDRPPLNANPVIEPGFALADAIANLATQAQNLNGRGATTPVGRTNEAAQLMHSFELECDSQINSTKEEAWRQMWNRASLKVMRLSALLAVADNCYSPCIQVNQVEWALSVVRKDIAIMSRRMSDGDVGVSDYSRERKVLACCVDFLREGAPEGYKIPDSFRENNIIPRKYIQIRTARVTSFANHRSGSVSALDTTLKSLVDGGYLMAVDQSKIVENFGFHGKCYRLLHAPTK